MKNEKGRVKKVKSPLGDLGANRQSSFPIPICSKDSLLIAYASNNDLIPPIYINILLKISDLNIICIFHIKILFFVVYFYFYI